MFRTVKTAMLELSFSAILFEEEETGQTKMTLVIGLDWTKKIAHQTWH